MSNQNSIFFSMLRHVLDEQDNVDWAMKTSLIYVKGFNANLEPLPITRIDQVDNILKYLNEAKPYHTNFSGLTEQQSAAQENGNVSVVETINPNIKLYFDRVSCDTDLPGFDVEPFDSELDSLGNELGFDTFDPKLANLNNAANRIFIYYQPESNQQKKNIAELMECNFKGYAISGGPLNIDEISFDTQFFEKFGFDIPIREAYYEITSFPDSETTDYGLLIDAVSDTEDYGSITDSVLDTLDFGSISDPIPTPVEARTFPIPFVPFETKKVQVFFIQSDGSKALTDYSYELDGLNVVFDLPPPVGVVVYIVVLDYDYLYDKLYVNSGPWLPEAGDEEILLDGDGFLRPHWDKNHPQELSPMRFLENVDIRVYTDQAQILGNEPGFDETPFDVLGFDLAEDDLVFITGGGPTAVTESFYKSEIQDQNELSFRPQSNSGLMVFVNGLLQTQDSDYEVDWSDPTYNDPGRDDHITNPRVTLLNSLSETDKVTFKYFGYGGSPILKRFRYFKTSDTEFDLEVTIPSEDYLFVTLNGEIAEFTLTGSVVELSSVPADSTVFITMFSNPDFTRVYSQSEASAGVFTLDNPPESSTPAIFGIQVWDQVSGKKLNPVYSKFHLAKAGEDTYPSSAPSITTADVYLDGELQVEGVDYSISGTDIVFGSIPSLNAEIAILVDGPEEFILSTVTDPNDTVTLTGANTAVRILTFPEDISMGLKIECYDGGVVGEYDVGGIPSSKSVLWVYLDGDLQYEGVDWVYEEVDVPVPTRTVRFLNNADHTGSVVQIAYMTERTTLRPIAFRVTKKPDGDFDFLRIAEKNTTELMVDYHSGVDHTIRVKDASVLGQPSPKTKPINQRTPGRIWVNNELIEFWGIDYSTSPHTLFNLRPGWNATGMGQIHEQGSKVIDASKKQVMPERLRVDKNSRVIHYTQNSGILRHPIPGTVRDPDDVNVWVRHAATLVNSLDLDDETITVSDSSYFILPGSTILESDIDAPAGSILSGDVLKIELNSRTSIPVSLTGNDATSVKTNIDANSQLVNRGLLTSVTADVISFEHLGAGDLVIENLSGYALQDLFGGQITGTEFNPIVAFGSGEGLTINGIDVVFDGPGLSSVIDDINNAYIENIIARNKNDYLQIVHLEAQEIVVADLVGTATTELGLVSSTASTVLETTNGVLQARGNRSSSKGLIWIDQEKIEFGWYDPFVIGQHELGDFVRDTTGIYGSTSYSAGKFILGSNQEQKIQGVHYNVFGNFIKFIIGQQPEVGSMIRIQSQPDVGRILIPDMIQSSDQTLARFLRSAPASRQ